jgi:hypothetical protein
MRSKNAIPHQVHLFTVSNDAEGNALITALRKSIRKSKTGRRVQIYGRGHRYGKGRIHVDKFFQPIPGTHGFDNSLQSSVPRHLAQKLAVYVSH